MVSEVKAEQRQVNRIEDLQDGMSDDVPTVTSSEQVVQEVPVDVRNQDPIVRMEVQERDVPKAPDIPNKENSVAPENQDIQKNVPFDREGFLRSEAAQRSLRKMILEAARVAKPGIELNWHRLTKRNPDYFKPDGFLLTIAEYRHLFFSKGRSDFMTDLSGIMSEILVGVVL
jgi:hypothetical protein